MEVFRSCSFLLLLVLAIAHCSVVQPARARREADYVDEDAAVTPRDDALQSDFAKDEGEQNDDGDEDDDADWKPSRLLSREQTVTARPGQSVRLPCTVENPDNAVIKWIHGTTMLYQASHTRDGKVDKNNKVILNKDWSIEIPSVTAADAGEYTCSLVGEPPQIVTHVLRLQNEPSPPKIVGIWPQGERRRLVEGQELRVTCQAEGHPQPTIRWSKTVGQENQRVTPEEAEFERDSMVIRNAQRHHAGTYICMAENNVGKPDLRSVAIQVVGKPRVHVHRTMENGAVGERAEMQCTVHEEPESQITWLKDGVILEGSDDVTVTVDYPHSYIHIPRVSEKDFGTYTCKASNMYGTHNRSVELVADPVLDELSVEDNALVWTIRSHAPLNRAQLNYRKADEEDSKWVTVNVKPEQTVDRHIHVARFPLSGLPAGRYEAVARASNDHGWGQPTRTYAFEDQPESILAAGVGSNLHSASADVKSATAVLLSTTFTCLLMRLL